MGEVFGAGSENSSPMPRTNRVLTQAITTAYAFYNQMQVTVYVYCVLPQLSAVTIRAVRSDVGLT
jgi:hypothetical protein